MNIRGLYPPQTGWPAWGRHTVKSATQAGSGTATIHREMTVAGTCPEPPGGAQNRPGVVGFACGGESLASPILP
jgi:hypothetical protein